MLKYKKKNGNKDTSEFLEFMRNEFRTIDTEFIESQSRNQCKNDLWYEIQDHFDEKKNANILCKNLCNFGGKLFFFFNII